MLHEIDSRTESPAPNLSGMGPRDTVYIHIHQSEDLNVLCLFVCFLVPHWNQTVPFVKTSVVIYGYCFL